MIPNFAGVVIFVSLAPSSPVKLDSAHPARQQKCRHHSAAKGHATHGPCKTFDAAQNTISQHSSDKALSVRQYGIITHFLNGLLGAINALRASWNRSRDHKLFQKWMTI